MTDQRIPTILETENGEALTIRFPGPVGGDDGVAMLLLVALEAAMESSGYFDSDHPNGDLETWRPFIDLLDRLSD